MAIAIRRDLYSEVTASCRSSASKAQAAADYLRGLALAERIRAAASNPNHTRR